jgi:aryl sulfotransferase
MGNIIWLASYPKSGNTWMRILLANYLADRDEPVDINSLGGGPIASARQVFDERVGIEAGDLTLEEIDNLRPAVYEGVSADATDTMFVKVHDAYTWNEDSEPVISKAATRGVLYMIRNPLDVAVSFAHHSAAPVARTVTNMTDDEFCFCDEPGRLPNQLRQKLLSWERHALSWIDDSGLDVHVVRYEDMKADTVCRFTEVIRYSGLDDDPVRIAKAVEFSQFESVKKQEEEKGFGEKMRKSESFFRKGQVGSWKEQLTPELIEQLTDAFGETMSRFGYSERLEQIAC